MRQLLGLKVVRLMAGHGRDGSAEQEKRLGMDNGRIIEWKVVVQFCFGR